MFKDPSMMGVHYKWVNSPLPWMSEGMDCHLSLEYITQRTQGSGSLFLTRQNAEVNLPSILV